MNNNGDDFDDFDNLVKLFEEMNINKEENDSRWFDLPLNERVNIRAKRKDNINIMKKKEN